MTGNNWLLVFRGEIDCSVILCVLTTPSTDTYCSLCSTLLCLTPHSSDSFSCREDRPGLWFIPISTPWPGRSAHSGMQIVFNSRLKCLVHHKCMVNVSCSWLYMFIIHSFFSPYYLCPWKVCWMNDKYSTFLYLQLQTIVHPQNQWPPSMSSSFAWPRH